MTQEEKAKAYDEALERAKGIHSFSSDIAEIKRMEQIFPELSESEDEKIRKELIQFIKNWKDHNNIGRPHDFPTLTRNVEQCDRYIAWLEKQKEFVSADFDDVWDTADCDELTAPLEKYSKDAIKKMCHAWYDKGIELERRNWLEKHGEQNDSDVKDYNSIDPHFGKSIDKIEPKFHKGDWIVHHGTGNIYQVVAVIDNQYQLKYGDTYTIQNCADVDRCARLWDVTKDAKDGDVLAYVTDEEDLWIMIYWSLYEPYEGHVHYHALLVNDNFSDKGTCCICINDLKPATKEQRDLLFQNMKEAGYEWDANKKELKKFHVIDEGKAEMDYCFTKMMNGEKVSSAWSEEDEKNWCGIMDVIEENKDTAPDYDIETYDGFISWLDNIKQRMEKQQ